jgi:UDP-N-acetylmuramate: L-alanyl-gamma-D-glutamyl-meso-diaminopimelate ligase
MDTNKTPAIHILGICGTFMGGIAALARQAGYRVTGCDANVYPPMSTQLEQQGIALIDGFGTEQLALNPDVFVIGNVVSRGNPLMEAILDRNLPYISGPQWLAENILQRGGMPVSASRAASSARTVAEAGEREPKWVLAVAGTHGKTTTSAMLAWILEYAGLNPGFLIGGVPQNFGVSARLTESPFFVIEADEYDTAHRDTEQPRIRSRRYLC